MLFPFDEDYSMPVSRGETILDLMEEIERMPGIARHRDLRSLDLSVYTFHRNYLALNTLLASLNTYVAPRLSLSQHQLRLLGRDLICCIHNYVAAAISILDHTKKLYEKLYNSPKKFPEYEGKFPEYWRARNAEFDKDLFSCFVKGLRNYCQHEKSPDFLVKTTYSNGTLVRKAKFPLKTLKEYKDWCPKEARKYVKALSEDVDIQDMANLYHNKMLHFCQWFRDRLSQIHATELENFRNKEDELQLLVIEDRIDSFTPFVGPHRASKHDVFYSIFSPEDFNQLEQTSLTVYEQAELSIKLLEEYFPVPEAIKKKITLFYQTSF